MRKRSFWRKMIALAGSLSMATTLCACELTDLPIEKLLPSSSSASVSEEEEITEWIEEPPEISVNSEGYVVFGKFEQDGNISNGKEPIEWEILETNTTGVLLITRYVLNCRQYNKELNVTNWGSSDLRMWLNTDFYTESFTNGDRLFIVPVTNKNESNPYWGTSGGNDTEEKVFILDLEEIRKYYTMDQWYDDYMFGLDSKLIVEATPAAVKNGVFTDTLVSDYASINEDYKRFANDHLFRRDTFNEYIDSHAGMTGAQWWVRTIGSNDSTTCFVTPYGRVGYYYAQPNDKENTGVRPCLYIKSLPE